jgi:anti-sigma factor RsiW
MSVSGPHLTDAELLLAAEGELQASRAAHLFGCGQCLAREQKITAAMASLIDLSHSVDPRLPPANNPRALLKERLAQAGRPRVSWADPALSVVWKRAAAIVLFAAALAGVYRYGAPTLRIHSATREVPLSFPEPNLTPGVAGTASREQVCKSSGDKNRSVAVSLRRRVFEEYGIQNAEPQAYEVDYLITPALGGADDIRNLWPQSTSAAMWNARVKDALEDRLREMVCDGKVDLKSAQREIASDWIAAYKKYFATDRPVESDR